jgi:hypothetical protein
MHENDLALAFRPNFHTNANATPGRTPSTLASFATSVSTRPPPSPPSPPSPEPVCRYVYTIVFTNTRNVKPVTSKLTCHSLDPRRASEAYGSAPTAGCCKQERKRQWRLRSCESPLRGTPLWIHKCVAAGIADAVAGGDEEVHEVHSQRTQQGSGVACKPRA